MAFSPFHVGMGEKTAWLAELFSIVAEGGEPDPGGVVPNRGSQKVKCFPPDASPRNSHIRVAFPAQSFNS